MISAKEAKENVRMFNKCNKIVDEILGVFNCDIRNASLNGLTESTMNVTFDREDGLLYICRAVCLKIKDLGFAAHWTREKSDVARIIVSW